MKLIETFVNVVRLFVSIIQFNVQGLLDAERQYQIS